MTPTITHAMILAAGLGSRLAPLTDVIPKPLVRVGGHTLIDRQIDHLLQAGVRHIVVNLHYKADLLQAHLRQHLAAECLQVIVEEERLETGGGVLNALPFLGTGPFYVMNADGLWQDGPGDVPFLDHLRQAWDPVRMDMLFMIVPKERGYGYDGRGDFRVTGGGLASGAVPLSLQGDDLPYIHACTRITSAAFFERYASEIQGEKRFGFSKLYRASEAGGERLYGLVFPTTWFHIGTIAGLKEAEELLEERTWPGGEVGGDSGRGLTP